MKSKLIFSDNKLETEISQNLSVPLENKYKDIIVKIDDNYEMTSQEIQKRKMYLESIVSEEKTLQLEVIIPSTKRLLPQMCFLKD